VTQEDADLDLDLEHSCWESFRNHWLICSTCRTHDWSTAAGFDQLCQEGRVLQCVWLIARDRVRQLIGALI
jgi:hypothetical protein